MIKNLEEYGEFLATIPDAALVVDAEGRIVLVNPNAEQMLGYAPGALRRCPLTLLLPEAARAGHEREFQEYFRRPQRRPMHTGKVLGALRSDGSELPVDIMLQPLVVNGAPMALAVLRDRSEHIRMEAELRKAVEREREFAQTDPLTGAANRRHFVDTVQREIDRLRRYGHVFSLAYIDLDNFKVVNDRFGHSAGDALLCQLVHTLGPHLREVDLLARLGGDEFALLLPETDAAGALATLRKVRASALELMRAHGWPVTLSIGLLTCREAPPSVDALVHAVDQLMYKAKSRGKNDIVSGAYSAAESHVAKPL